MDPYSFKRIADPVHGTIGLSEPEVRIVNSKAFQRLRNIRHLGLAYYVYPSAGFCRFSHSLGTCHMMGRTIEALRRNGNPIEKKDYQLYRIAALLHDIGHYPFSHAMERALKNFHAMQLLDKTHIDDQVSYKKHDELCSLVMENDAELNSILKNSGFKPRDIHAIIMRSNPKFKLNSLIKSDLDADRIDYLLRTAYHCGLPYGSVDIEYLLSQIMLDSNKQLCFTPKAVKTIDHFLLSRYFAYQQVSFHKTVAAFELILQDVIVELLRSEMLKCTSEDISELIRDGVWCDFTDTYLFEILKKNHNISDSSVFNEKVKSLLMRNPPKLVWRFDFLGHEVNKDKDRYNDKKKRIEGHIMDFVDRFKIDRDLWIIDDKGGFRLTEAEPIIRSSSSHDTIKRTQDEVDQAVHILGRDKISKPVFDLEDSLSSILSNYALYSYRLFVLLPDGSKDKGDQITEEINKIMSS
jgi:hypothetical protein